MNKLEKYIERYFVNGVAHAGGWAIKICPDFVNGIPDRLVLFRGRAYFVELKRPKGGIISKLQKHVAGLLLKFGFVVTYVFTIDDADKFIDEVLTT